MFHKLCYCINISNWLTRASYLQNSQPEVGKKLIQKNQTISKLNRHLDSFVRNIKDIFEYQNYQHIKCQVKVVDQEKWFGFVLRKQV